MTTQSVTPYLTVRDAAGAIAFYQQAFGAKETTRMPADDGKRVLHAELAIGDGKIFLSDEFGEHGGPPAPSGDGVGVAVALGLDAPAAVDATFKQATAAGAKGTMEPVDTFWGARFAMLQDPYGHRWMLNAPLAQA